MDKWRVPVKECGAVAWRFIGARNGPEGPPDFQETKSAFKAYLHIPMVSLGPERSILLCNKSDPECTPSSASKRLQIATS
jgi:hypothetical protein